jgi:hypothetical protein
MRKLYAAYVRSTTKTQCNPLGFLVALILICLVAVRYGTVIGQAIHIAIICIVCALAVTALAGLGTGIVWLTGHQQTRTLIATWRAHTMGAESVIAPVTAPAELQVTLEDGSYTYVLGPEGVERVQQPI